MDAGPARGALGPRKPLPPPPSVHNTKNLAVVFLALSKHEQYEMTYDMKSSIKD